MLNSVKQSAEAQTGSEDEATLDERVIVCEKPKVTFDQIVGQQEAKRQLQKLFLSLRKDIVKLKPYSPHRMVILYGPSGTGKTMLVEALASENNATFMRVSADDIMSKWSGQAEKNVRKMIDLARKHQPCIVFVDEADQLFGIKGNDHNLSTSQTLQIGLNSLCSTQEKVFVVLATNFPQKFPDSVLRRGIEVFVPLPGLRAREALLKRLIPQVFHLVTESEVENLAYWTDNYSNADLVKVITEASDFVIEKREQAHFFKEVFFRGAHTFMPCLESEPGAISRHQLDYQTQSITPPMLMSDINKALGRIKPHKQGPINQELKQFQKKRGFSDNLMSQADNQDLLKLCRDRALPEQYNCHPDLKGSLDFIFRYDCHFYKRPPPTRADIKAKEKQIQKRLKIKEKAERKRQKAAEKAKQKSKLKKKEEPKGMTKESEKESILYQCCLCLCS
jgi:SpoVK/Ycf46/Vps4 family AAA+-type ATPase